MSQEESNQIQYPSLVVVVRHAESLRNRVKKGNPFLPSDESAAVLEGVPDHRIPITDRGYMQALAIGPCIRRDFGLFDVIYHSGYLRTVQTMDAVLEAYSSDEISRMKIRENAMIGERKAGYTYDMDEAQAKEHFPYLEKHFKHAGPFYATPIGGQSQFDLSQIVYTFIGELRRIRAGKSVLIFSHGGTIRSIRYRLERWTVQQYEDKYQAEAPENCGVTVYRYSEHTGRLDLEEFNRLYWTESMLTRS
jgi:2,3-bisphosphoglycerate-dependent phosphoglycerate mutase